MYKGHLDPVKVAGDEQTLASTSSIAISIIQVHDPQFFAGAMREQRAWDLVQQNAQREILTVCPDEGVAHRYGEIKSMVRVVREKFLQIDALDHAAAIVDSARSVEGAAVSAKFRAVAGSSLKTLSGEGGGVSYIEELEAINSQPVREWIASTKQSLLKEESSGSKHDASGTHFELPDTLAKFFEIGWNHVFAYPSTWSVISQYLYMAIRIAGDHEGYYRSAFYISARFADQPLLESLVY